tara:strand:- start:529 stop:750 length:222 start_codon:yes stop_codon:yes gene_type:complete
VAYFVCLYNRKLAINPKIEHKLYGILMDQSSMVLFPNNGSSVTSAIVHNICANKKKRNVIVNKKPIFFMILLF